MKKIVWFIMMIIGWGVIMQGQTSVPGQTFDKKVNDHFEKGYFSKAEKRIYKLIGTGDLTEDQIWELRAQLDIMKRIRQDFSKTLDDILPKIKEYYPDVTKEQLRVWEKSGALECMMIDGKKKYFYHAVPNLFRIDPDARAVKNAKDNPAMDSLDKTLNRLIPEMVQEARNKETNLLSPVHMRLNYTMTLEADAIPPGECVRCWMPFPREEHERQTDITLINTSEKEYLIADNSHLQRSIYMEKTTKAGSPTEFNVVFEITTRPEVYFLKEEAIKPYDTTTALYKKYTSERETHIRFTPEIKALSDIIVGDETHPLIVARKIFKYISDHYPWASAREYSTIPNIPLYVIENKSGDCGQVTLLLLTLCRYNGIPARWQSGWMLHPGDVNLHDWGELYFEGVGWVPVDQSFGRRSFSDPEMEFFFLGGIDAYRLIVNDDYSFPLYPAKTWLRSETVDFQRGEMEWRGGNLYFNLWDWHMEVEYLDE
ncbi:MAG: transglutaminase-like domain-containing protein [Candidatus Marinimicrobia bacterium]|nr:transglutaminase-like domain-containing protein [Candidatus Neomarinimicrobiota bacterium]